MENDYREILRKAILDSQDRRRIVASISQETITYEPSGVWVDPRAPGFTNTTGRLTDEELVRAYLLLKFAGPYGYKASPDILEVERVYKPVGRPTGKGGRADVPRPANEEDKSRMLSVCGVQIPRSLRS